MEPSQTDESVFSPVSPLFEQVSVSYTHLDVYKRQVIYVDSACVPE